MIDESRHYDIIIVGAGPAGSSCAARLVENGAKVLVLDRNDFPRLKLCAGWITPQVLVDLNLEVANYPYRLNTFATTVAHIKGFSASLNQPQHSIRRVEFDQFLLQRSRAQFATHRVKNIVERNGRYLIDDRFTCEYLVGAAGTGCPVYRTLFRDLNPRARELQTATFEHEFAFDWQDPRCHLWFFEGGLPGYAWYVPKANGYLNVGIGGMATMLRTRDQDIKAHWRNYIELLVEQKFLSDIELSPKGYGYYLRGNVDCVQRDKAFIIGDAAGLATRDLCEGIGPAIQSGQSAADSILTGTEYKVQDISAFSSGHSVIRKSLEYMFVTRTKKASVAEKSRLSA